MTEEDIWACIALTDVPGVGSVTAKHLLSWFDRPCDIFSVSEAKLQQVEGVGSVTAKAIRESRKLIEKAKSVHEVCNSKKIRVLTSLDEDYPYRLKQIPDAPVVLYTIGEGAQEQPRTLSIVGTRKNSAYGKRITHDIVEQLAGTGITVISGLAFGIDTCAHKAALAFGLKTFAVLATPLNQVYPAQNRALAVDIFKDGRLYSEYAPGTKVDARNFPMRNRIIAGLSDATLVVEAGESGGALITASLAQDYDRQVFAVPGRLGDEASVGCLNLISQNRAAVFTSVDAFLQEMGWHSSNTRTGQKKVAQLPDYLTVEELKLVKILAGQGLHIDDISFAMGVPLNTLAGMLLKLEFDGVVVALPGKKFKLADAYHDYRP